MKKAGMATHSVAAFNETQSINILTSFLESMHTIKTFFKENDRTPNYDGSFELISDDRTPKKQFIVQIKKAESLKPKRSGPNKGKYVYDLETKLFYYVKAKVTESPAIYFVVDIITQKIFWLYLSDKFLMDLNFEGHEIVSYAFTEENVLSDIVSFTERLNQIATERNRLFVNKTAEEIAEIQDAVDYINKYLDNDFAVVKKTILPNLWRIGIKHSVVSNISFTHGTDIITSPNTAAFAFYPQHKGMLDYGLREYYHENTDLFTLYDMTGTTHPMEYSKRVLHDIMIRFFEGRIPLWSLPDTVLMEIVGSFVKESDPLFENGEKPSKINLAEIEKRFFYLANYIQFILLSDDNNASEQIIYRIINNQLLCGGRFFCRMAETILHSGAKRSFQEFCAENPNIPLSFIPKLMDIIDRDYIQCFCVFAELKRRGITEFSPVWILSYRELCILPPAQQEKEAKQIVACWFQNLPSLYDETYKKLFESNKYRFHGKYVYRVYTSVVQSRPHIFNVIHAYDSDSFQIANDESIEESFNDYYRKQGVKSISRGFMVEHFLDQGNMYLDSISCLLYQGICAELGFEPRGLSLSRRLYPGLQLFN